MTQTYTPFLGFTGFSGFTEFVASSKASKKRKTSENYVSDAPRAKRQRLLGGAVPSAADRALVAANGVHGPLNAVGRAPSAAVVHRSLVAGAAVAADEAMVDYMPGDRAETVLREAANAGSVTALRTLQWHRNLYQNDHSLIVTAQVQLTDGSVRTVRAVLDDIRNHNQLQGNLEMQRRIGEGMIKDEFAVVYPGKGLSQVLNLVAVPGPKHVELSEVRMLGVELDSRLFDSMSKHAVYQRPGLCVLDYIVTECAAFRGDINRRKIAGLDDVTIREQFSHVTSDDQLGVSVEELDAWIQRYQHPISFHAVDPLTMEVFASRESGPECVILTFIVARGHCYPITRPELRRTIFNHRKLDLNTFGMLVTDTPHFTYLEGTADNMERIVAGSEEKEEELIFTDADMCMLMTAVVTEHGQIPDQVEVHGGKLTCFVHPVTMQVIRATEDWDIRKEMCEYLYEKFPCAELEWRGQSVSKLSRALGRALLPDFPMSSHVSPKTTDAFSTVPLVHRLEGLDAAADGVAIDCNRCYASSLYANTWRFPVFTALDDILPWDGSWFREELGVPEFYLTRTALRGYLTGVTLPAQVISEEYARYLVDEGFIRREAITHYRMAKTFLSPDLFTPLIDAVNEMEEKIGNSGNLCKNMLNHYIGCLNIKNQAEVNCLLCVDHEEALCHFVRQRELNRRVDILLPSVNHSFSVVRSEKRTRKYEDSSPVWTHVVCGAAVRVLQMAVLTIRTTTASLVGIKSDALYFTGITQDELVVNSQWKLEEFYPPYSSWIPNRDLFVVEAVPEWEDHPMGFVSLEESCFVTGPGGSGKTHTVVELIKANPDIRVVCLAFTNQAVGVLRKKLDGAPNAELYTIDSALSKHKHSGLSFDSFSVLVLDEISMVSRDKMEKITKIAPAVRIVMGDFGQLEAIEAAGGFQYDLSETGMFRRFVGGNRVQLAFREGQSRGSRDLHELLVQFRRSGRIPDVWRDNHLENLPDNIVYHNSVGREIIESKRRPPQIGDWIRTERGVRAIVGWSEDKKDVHVCVRGEMESVEYNQDCVARFQPGDKVVMDYNSYVDVRQRIYKKAELFHSAFHVVSTVKKDGYTLVGSDTVVFEKHLKSQHAVTAHKYQGSVCPRPYNIHQVAEMSKRMFETCIGRATCVEHIHFDYTPKLFTNPEKRSIQCNGNRIVAQYAWLINGEYTLTTSMEKPEMEPGGEATYLHRTYCASEKSCKRLEDSKRGKAWIRIDKQSQALDRNNVLKTLIVSDDGARIAITVGGKTIRKRYGREMTQEEALEFIQAKGVQAITERYGSLGTWRYKSERKGGTGKKKDSTVFRLECTPKVSNKEPILVPQGNVVSIEAEKLVVLRTISDHFKKREWFDKKMRAVMEATKRRTNVIKWGNWHFAAAHRFDLVDMIHRSMKIKIGELYEDLSYKIRMCADLDMELTDDTGPNPVDSCLAVIKAANEVALSHDVHLDTRDWVVQNATRIGKLSFHIICEKEVFERLNHQLSFWREVVAKIKTDHPDLCWMKELKRSNGQTVMEERCIVDLAIYKSAQPMRCLYSEKKGKGNFLLPMEHSQGTLIPFTGVMTRQMILANLCTHGDTMCFSSLAVEVRRAQSTIVRRLGIPRVMVALSKDKQAELKDLIVPEGFSLMNSRMRGMSQIRLDRVTPGFCPCCKRVHTHENGFLLVREGVWQFSCYKGGNSVIVEKTPPVVRDPMDVDPPMTVQSLYAGLAPKTFPEPMEVEVGDEIRRFISRDNARHLLRQGGWRTQMRDGMKCMENTVGDVVWFT